ncbi:MAG: response regulator [Gammaproteobacteria bacterium]|nr:response regulator [Gammaproteobacteria bacterium]MBU1776521.1 response regulator [Gammaproteobacteria bacterium]MBU1968915.1 response regulator [Gammaproteobacteria bacterium]
MDEKNILVVDDDAGLRELLLQYLGAQGYHVATVADGAAMDAYRAANPVDLIILDLMLPGEDGLSLARKLRAQSDLPIIMLSARGEDVDRIVGLEVGADDYLAKPFNPRELLARIRALLRRSDGNHDAAGDISILHFGDFALNLDTHDLHRNGSNIPLTAGEFNLLRIFAEHPNRVLSRDSIMDMLKGYERSPFDRSIDVRVTRLRRKIESDPNNPAYIRTVWGEGYLFASAGEKA